MRIKQFRYGADNLGYLIHGKRAAMAVDGGAVDDIEHYLHAKGLKLEVVTNTHMHPDHTPGNQSLIDRTGASLLDHRTLMGEGAIELDGDAVEVIPTPGHSMDSVTFHCDHYLVTGDTLFIGTVGNCFSGDFHRFFTSIKSLMAFPDETVVYPGHDYVRESITYAMTVEPENPALADFLQNKYDVYHVFSTLGDEREINIFLKFNGRKMIAALEKQGKSVATEFERWLSIYETY